MLSDIYGMLEWMIAKSTASTKRLTFIKKNHFHYRDNFLPAAHLPQSQCFTPISVLRHWLKFVQVRGRVNQGANRKSTATDKSDVQCRCKRNDVGGVIQAKWH